MRDPLVISRVTVYILPDKLAEKKEQRQLTVTSIADLDGNFLLDV